MLVPRSKGGARRGVCGRPAARDCDGRPCRPTPLRCSVAWPAAELASFASLTALRQPRRVRWTMRAARAATRPALLGVAHAHSRAPAHASAWGSAASADRQTPSPARRYKDMARHDDAADEAAPEEPGAAHAADEPAAVGARAHRARHDGGGGRRQIRAAGLRALPGGAVPAARRVPSVPFAEAQVDAAARRRRAAERDGAASQQRSRSTASGCRGGSGSCAWTRGRR